MSLSSRCLEILHVGITSTPTTLLHVNGKGIFKYMKMDVENEFQKLKITVDGVVYMDDYLDKIWIKHHVDSGADYPRVISTIGVVGRNANQFMLREDIIFSNELKIEMYRDSGVFEYRFGSIVYLLEV